MFLQDFYSQKYEPLALRTRAANTKRLYRSTLVSFARFLKRQPKLADLTDETVAGFAAWRIQQGRSRYTVNKDLFNLLAIWRWAHRKGYLDRWPDVPLEPTPERAPVALLHEELDALVAAAGRADGWIGENLARHWWVGLLLVAWDTGERIGAILALGWPNVDLRSGWVRFVAENRKGGLRDAHQQVGPDTVAALKRLGPKRGLVFPWPMNHNYLWKCFGRIVAEAGLPDDRLHKFHSIRKSVASHFEAAGGNATELLGHSSRRITLAYLDQRITHPRQAVDLLFRLGG